MDNTTTAVITLVTPILTKSIMTLMTQRLTMRAQTMLIMTMLPMQTGRLMPLILMDADNSEDDDVNGGTD